MIDIPLGKALVPIERTVYPSLCEEVGCFFADVDCHCITCGYETRKDGKNVIFKLVDYRVEGEK